MSISTSVFISPVSRGVNPHSMNHTLEVRVSRGRLRDSMDFKQL